MELGLGECWFPRKPWNLNAVHNTCISCPLKTLPTWLLGAPWFLAGAGLVNGGTLHPTPSYFTQLTSHTVPGPAAEALHSRRPSGMVRAPLNLARFPPSAAHQLSQQWAGCRRRHG